MKRKNKKILALMVFFMVAVMFSSTAVTAFAAPKTTSAIGSSVSDLVQSSGTTGLNTVKDFVDPDKIEATSTIKANQTVSLVIEMDGNALVDEYLARQDEFASYQDYLSSSSGRIAVDNLKAKQRAEFNRISNKVNCKLGYQYTGVMNAFSIEIAYKDRSKVDAAVSNTVTNTFVAERYEMPQYTVVTNEVVAYDTGIFDSSSTAYKGEGMLVAVLDTGLDHTHEAFSTKNLPMLEDGETIDMDRLALTKEDVKAKLSALSANDRSDALTATDLYINEKVPFAFDYSDKDTNVNTHIDNMHGTHVAGIIAGKSDDPKDKDGNPVYDKKGDVMTGITGVAPLAQLAIMKVFGDTENGAEQEDILAALEDCITLGVDALNMSLGRDCGFTTEAGDDANIQAVYDRLEAVGISVVVAASNSFSSSFQSHYGLNFTSNPDSATVGSPATYKASISVASIAGVYSKYLMAVDTAGNELGIAYYNESAHVDSTQYDFMKEIFASVEADPTKIGEENITRNAEGKITAVKVEYVLVPGTGDIVNYAGLSVKNKIALVQRGVLSFEDKVKNAEKMGALACVVYNNVAGVISMQIGDDIHIPSCAIKMDAAYTFRGKKGSIIVSEANKAGPFMSDFSSWGPTPSLNIKPEITAHGGEIYSAAPGAGNYDRISGTSMACPNLAGVVLLLRQHMKENAAHYDLYKDGTTEIDLNKLERRVYQLLMSTATIALNEDGNPYAVRKQGAGLASLINSLKSDSYIITEELDEEGNKVEMDKTKLELMDDPERTGVYNLEFKVRNLGSNAHSYNLGAIVTTESLSTDRKTVAEKSYMLDDTSVAAQVVGDVGSIDTNMVLTVPANSTVELKVTLTLSEAAKNYINTTFENGMYVEGYITLDAINESGVTADDENYAVDLNVCYLAFYGDWADSPIFDYTIYEQEEDEADDSIKEDDKRWSNARAATFYAKMYENGNEYMFEAGRMLFYTAEEYEETVIQKDYCSLSDKEHAMCEIYVLSGFLRGCKTVDMEVYDDATGELMHKETFYNARKATALMGVGGVLLERDPSAWGCVNGGKYTINVVGYLDWDDGKSAGKSNTMSYTFYMDSQSPIIANSNLRVEEDSDENITKYLDLDVFENHYISACDFRIWDKETNEYQSIYTDGMRPISGGRNTTNRISFDLTNYWYLIEQNNYKVQFVVYDYAFNYAWYNMNLREIYRNAKNIQFGDFGVTSKFYKNEGGSVSTTDYKEVLTSIKDEVKTENGNALTINEINIIPNQLIELEKMLLLDPVDTWEDDLVWSCPQSCVKIDDETGEIFGVSPGTAKVTVHSKLDSAVKATLTVNVLDERVISQYNIVVPTVNNRLGGLKVDEESEVYTHFAKALKADQTYTVTATLDPWYYEAEIGERYFIQWSSSNPTIASVTSNAKTDVAYVRANASTKDENGEYVSNLSGAVQITGRVMERTDNGDKTTPYSVSLFFVVKEEFVVEGGVLTEYNGSASKVVIPDNKDITTIGYGVFMNKTGITEVIVPEGVEKLDRAAFAYCRDLVKIKLPSTIEHIGDYAFAAKIENNMIRTNLIEVDTTAFAKPVYVGYAAFLYQIGLGISNIDEVTDEIAPKAPVLYDCKLDLSMVRTVDDIAFAMTRCFNDIDLTTCSYVGVEAFLYCGDIVAAYSTGELEGYEKIDGFPEVKFSKYSAVGDNAFAYSGFETLELPMSRINTGAFVNNQFLRTLTFTGEDVYIEDSAFAICYSIEKLTFEGSVNNIGYMAFYQDVAGMAQYGIAPAVIDIEFKSTCRSIDDYAFYGESFTTFELPAGLEHIGQFAVANCGSLTEVIINKDCALKNFDSVVFYQSDKLTTFSGESAYLTTEDGAVVSKVDNALILLPAAKNVVTYTLPASATKIAPYAFGANLTLKSVTIHENVVSIGEGAFMYCPGLENVVFEGVANLEEIGVAAFADCGRLKSIDLSGATNLEVISEDTFAGCGSLTEIKLPNTIHTIGAGAFAMTGIKSFVVPELVTEIADNVFSYASALSEVVFHDGVTKIGNYAFTYTSLNKITGDGVNGITYVGDYAFAYNMILEEVSLSNAVEIGKFAFQATSGSAGSYRTLLTNVNLPKVEVVNEKAFINNINLETLNLPAAVEIKESAFENCSISSLTLGNVEKIGKSAFANNDFATFEIAATLTDIQPQAFRNVPVTAYTVAADNEKYFAENGVVYMNAVNTDEDEVTTEGYQLVLYPIAAEATEYTVKEGTLRIEEYSFYGAQNLTKITLSEALCNIGARAFYAANNLKYYKFLSHEAPVLETEAVIVPEQSWDVGDESYYSNFGFAWQNYANFVGSFSPSADPEEEYMYNMVVMQSEDDPAEMFDPNTRTYRQLNGTINGGGRNKDVDFGLTIEYPANASGFDILVYTEYFTTKVAGTEFLEEKTKNIISNIAAIKDAAQITLADQIAVLNARKGYNALREGQQAYVTNIDRLVAAEAKIAELKANAHTCESQCPICGKCTDATCTDSACSDKCPGHDNKDDEDDDKKSSGGCGCGTVGGSDNGINSMIGLIAIFAVLAAAFVIRTRKQKSL